MATEPEQAKKRVGWLFQRGHSMEAERVSESGDRCTCVRAGELVGDSNSMCICSFHFQRLQLRHNLALILEQSRFTPAFHNLRTT